MQDDSDRIIGLYQRHGLSFDRERGRSLFEKTWLDRFLALVPEGGSILDLGCGSGEPIARYLAEAGHKVTVVDTSPVLLRLGRERLPDQTWIEADMRTLALNRRFGGILAWDSFFHLDFDDQRRMFPIFRAHARPRAPLMFTIGPAHGEAIGSFEGEPLHHASLDPDEYRALLDGNGFEVVSCVPEDPDCGGHTVWLARSRQQSEASTN